MIGKQDRGQRTLFIPGDMEELIPADHILKRLNCGDIIPISEIL